MVAPPEIAWIVPIVMPFIIGLLIGIIVKRTVKLILAITALLFVLAATGYVSINFPAIYDEAMRVLPRLIMTGESVRDVLPYASVTFLLGLALGLWKG